MRPYPTLATPDRSSKVNAVLRFGDVCRACGMAKSAIFPGAVLSLLKGSGRTLLEQPLRNGNGVAAGAYRMHPDAPHPAQGKHGG
jgi:hypothetical protein